jgi:hypothetical protein
VTARASQEQIQELAARTDERAEIQNTVRAAVPVSLVKVEAHPI